MAINMFAPPPQLPHPEIHISVLLVIEDALRRAWSLLRMTPPPGFDLANAKEDEITQQFYLIVCNRVLKERMVDGFNGALFCVVREAKYGNYSGNNTEKMPDLIVKIIQRTNVQRPSDDGLFIECKPVDAVHTAGKAYCGEGLIRFVEGSYAWTMRQAMMIGYVRAGYTILPKFHDALRSRAIMMPPKRIETLQYPFPCPDAASQANLWCEAIHISRHKRSFSYIETNQAAPPITLRHLWLRCD